jgi:hypothetical protein
MTTKTKLAPAYAWLITRDVLHDNGEIEDNEAGVAGPAGMSPDQLRALEAGKGTPFRMYDDDGELLYEGRLLTMQHGDEGNYDLSPLDDFGMPNAGCTRIDVYRNGKWEIV